MSKETETTTTEVGTEVGTDTEVVEDVSTETKTTVEDDKVDEVEVKTDKEIMIPKSRFDEVNEKYKSIETKYAEMQKQQEELEKQLQGVQETKVEEPVQTEATEKLEKQVQQYETLISEMVEAKVNTIPEEFKELVPEGLSNDEKLAWLNKAEETGLFKKPEKKQIEIGQPLNHSANQAPEESKKKLNPLQLLASYYGQN